MTTSKPRPDLRPPGLNTDEKTTLLTFLDYLRESVLAKAVGVPEPHGSARPVCLPGPACSSCSST